MAKNKKAGTVSKTVPSPYEKGLTGNQRRFSRADYKYFPPSVQCRLCEPYRKRIHELERLAATLAEGFDRTYKGEL